ncbi:lipopolysaccharide biosynthesis protein [Streptosporangium sp. NPDC051022]|uniref:lipopolysaccharide biosynthesis protein n=1 Tax=Streptosporangium sp. NPDC051022 TaxID=3155752 RepID=UPI0034356B35
MENTQGAEPAEVRAESGEPDPRTPAGEPATPASQVGEIGRQAGRGLRWSVMGTVLLKAGSFVMSLILARLLAPEDFGVYAIALSASQFVIYINDAGVIAATVQWRGKLEDMAPTATVVAISSSLALYGIFWIAAPYFSSLSGSESAAGVIRVLTAVNLVYGMTAVRSAALMRRFEQDKLTKANLVGFLVTAPISITLAVNGAGAYSFAVGQLSGAVVTGVLVVAYARVRIGFGLDRVVAKRLLIFGLPLCFTLGIEGVLLNADSVIVGNALGRTQLGYYLLAFNISSWVPGIVGTAVRYVALPSFSRLAEEDRDSLSLGVQRAVPMLISIVLPVAVLMGTLATAMVVFLYGERWRPSAAVLTFLAVVMVVRMLIALAFDILASMGKTKATFWLNLGWAVAMIPGVMVGARLGGIQGAAMGHAAIALVVALPLGTFVLGRAGVVLTPLLSALVRPLVGGVLSAVVTTVLAYLVHGSPFVQLVVAGGTGLLVYVLVVVPQAVLKQLGGRVTELIPVRSR